MAILEGSVVFVDDDYQTSQSHAEAFLAELKRQGRPVAVYDDVPPLDHIAHWDGLALVVLDWRLDVSETDFGEIDLPEDVTAATTGALIDFLKALLVEQFCPVFIVSQEGSETIERELRAADGFPGDVIGRRVQILQKEDVDLLPRLETLVEGSPVLSTLRIWEQQYQRAKNRMFIDLDALDTSWLVYVSKFAQDGGTDYGYELVEALYGNLRHRVDPGAFTDALFRDDELPSDSEARRRVVHGRTVLPKGAVNASTIMPGDYFAQWKADCPANDLWLNVTPACDTVLGRPGGRPIRLYLLRGIPEAVKSDGTARELREARLREPNSVTIDVMHDGAAYRFLFRSLEIVDWDTVKDYRLGRVLAPFITDVQHRHAMYLLREGLPAVLPMLYG